MLIALEEGHKAGGDRRGDKSAALVVVGVHPEYEVSYDRIVDLRVDFSPNPVDELKKLYRAWFLIMGARFKHLL